MFKKSLLALALMSGALSASAAEQGYDWSFQGFMSDDVFDPSVQIKGRFVVDDVNADGIFSNDEVVSFVFENNEFTRCCDSTYLDNFSYTPGGKLDFRLSVTWYEFGNRATFVTANKEIMRLRGGWGDSTHMYSEDYKWTDQTRLTVSAVPEPQTWLMLGAGLLLTAGAARRRRKQASR
ncbi:MAG TPA: PEP-CTERM sorting domain-containing protein [Telluria sp.]|jgi:hypothetical protein